MSNPLTAIADRSATPSIEKKRRRALTDAERSIVRTYWHSFSEKPLYKDLITWFDENHYHKLSASQINHILSPQFAYLDSKRRRGDLSIQRTHIGKWPDLEAALNDWQLEMNRRIVTITGELLKEMAAQIWRNLPQYTEKEIPSFNDGWLYRFKKRYHIRRTVRYGEAAIVDDEQLELNLVEIRVICDEYPLCDIYNMDETDLFWRAIPGSTLSSERQPDGKKEKDRITANLCCNADGSHKLPI
jgi:Tc5 transposase DNA-binding domain/Fission yeast centromere protein N-terminal domain